jgi:putative flippase GtrA
MPVAGEVRARPAGMQLVTRYVLFALIAGAVNLAAQAVTLYALRALAPVLPAIVLPYQLTLAMAVGTVAGLLPKYLLDQRWIFTETEAPGARQHARNLPLYALTAVFTTFIFWGVEYLFDAVLGGAWHYVGGAIGLAIGYRVKYSLDRDFVFGSARA